MNTPYSIDSLKPEDIKLGLERVNEVAEKLNIKKANCPIITVTGTNGKGTFVETLSQALRKSGYRVGTYTSPHLNDLRERAVIASQSLLSESAWLAAFTAVEQARGATPLTYFEVITLAAFYLFKQHPLDYIVAEVGLGGRLDAVNVWDPTVSVFTSLGLDHQQWLGNTLESIGFEKAGIARKHRPAIVSEYAAKPGLLSALEQNRASVWIVPGEADNLALAVCEALDIHLDQKIVLCKPPGRQEIRIYRDREWFLDVAHNPDAVKRMVDSINKRPSKDQQVLFGVMQDKAISEIVSLVAPKVGKWHCVPCSSPRGATKSQLQQALGAYEHQWHDTIEQGMEAILANSQPGDRIIVFGSFEVVGPVRNHMESN